MKRQNIEFFENKSTGSIICHHIDTESFEPFLPESTHITDFMLRIIEENYPKANQRLNDNYRHHANFSYTKVLRFIKCNFSIYNNVPDIDCEENINLEDVVCPLKCHGLLCRDQNVICHPELTTVVSQREKEYIPYLISGLTSQEIATQMYRSHFTVENTRKHIYRKLNISGKNAIAQLATWAAKNGII